MLPEPARSDHHEDPRDTGQIEQTGVEQGAVAVITDSAGRLLLHLRDDIEGIAWPGYWSVLGGGCDPGESPSEAIVRELDEEAGLTVHNLQPLMHITDVHGSGQLLTVFTGTWDGNEHALPLTEGVKLQFFDPTQLDVLDIPPHICAALANALVTARP